MNTLTIRHGDFNRDEQRLSRLTLDAFRSRNIRVLLSSLCTVTLSFQISHMRFNAPGLEDHARDWAQERDVPFLSLAPAMQQAFAEHKMTMSLS